MTTARRRFLLLATWMLSCAAVWPQSAPAAGASPGGQGAQSQVFAAPRVPAAATEQTAQPIDPRVYVIGAEDLLRIEVWREQELTRTVAVRPDGKITLPLLNDIQAEGLTPERLSEHITQGLADRIVDPQVTVSIFQVNSKKYTITGMVNLAGAFPLVTPITIFDAINKAGGFREFADDKNIVIVRGKDRLKFNYRDFLKGKKMTSPRGPIYIDPAEREIVQNIYIREVQKRDGKLVNVDIGQVDMVKDPWKIDNPAKTN